MKSVKYGRDYFVNKQTQNNTDTFCHSPQAGVVQGIAGLCSGIIGAVKVFINKKS